MYAWECQACIKLSGAFFGCFYCSIAIAIWIFCGVYIKLYIDTQCVSYIHFLSKIFFMNGLKAFLFWCGDIYACTDKYTTKLEKAN